MSELGAELGELRKERDALIRTRLLQHGRTDEQRGEKREKETGDEREMNICGNQEGDYVCTREAGHEGPHVSSDADDPSAIPTDPQAEKRTRRNFFTLCAVGGSGVLVGNALRLKQIRPIETEEEVTLSDGTTASTDRLAHGEHDSINSRLLYARLQTAGILAQLFPGGIPCMRCKWPYDVITWHITQYDPPGDQRGRGVFALCNDCWNELWTPEQRLPYYLMLVDKYWARDPLTLIDAKARKKVEEDRKKIIAAVMAEK